ncbi:hypothetical protein REPUB_Repub03eG0132400 [Reevesia pubescens]
MIICSLSLKSVISTSMYWREVNGSLVAIISLLSSGPLILIHQHIRSVKLSHGFISRVYQWSTTML